MKVFAIIVALALVGSSHAILGGIGDIFKNLGHELGEVAKDLVHTAQPVATSLLQTLEKAGTQLLTTAASDLLSHLGTAGKRDLSDIMQKVGSFVTKGEQYLKQTGALLEGAFKGTVAQIHNEITHVLSDAKPLEHLVEEVKSAVAGHNSFVDNLISKAEQEGQKLVSEIMHLVPHKRDLASFGSSIKHLLEEVANPIKGLLGGAISKLEGEVLQLLG